LDESQAVGAGRAEGGVIKHSILLSQVSVAIDPRTRLP
jgi:hypothetical protein